MFGSVEKAGEEQKNHMKKQYAVLGLGRFGYAVAVTLAQAGNQVLAVDSSEELVQEISDYVTYAVRADITDTNVFASLGISDMDVVIVGIAQNMQASILATIQSKEVGVPYVIAKCLSKIHADILTRVGADKVIMAEYETGVRLAKNLISGGFRDLFELSDDFSVAELTVPAAWVGKTLEQLQIRGEYGVNIIALKGENEIQVNVDPRQPLQAGEFLVMVGKNEDLAKVPKE